MWHHLINDKSATKISLLGPASGVQAGAYCSAGSHMPIVVRVPGQVGLMCSRVPRILAARGLEERTRAWLSPVEGAPFSLSLSVSLLQKHTIVNLKIPSEGP